MLYQQKGFFLIEMVIIIALTTLLVLTVSPRFGSFTQNAQISATQTIAGSFGHHINLMHTEWDYLNKENTAAGSDGKNMSAIPNRKIIFSGKTLGMSLQGWPEFTDTPEELGVMTDQKCEEIWLSIFESRPSIGTVRSCRNKSCDFLAKVHDKHAEVCEYIDQNIMSSVIQYDITTGLVTM